MTNPPADNPPAVPPYEGRQESAKTESETYKDGARTAGATAPVSDPDMKSAEPSETPGGATASPSDEMPAEDMPGGEDPQESTGPAHEPGTGRGEGKQ